MPPDVGRQCDLTPKSSKDKEHGCLLNTVDSEKWLCFPGAPFLILVSVNQLCQWRLDLHSFVRLSTEIRVGF